MYTKIQKPACVSSDPRLPSGNAQAAVHNESCIDLEPPGWQAAPAFHTEMWKA